MRKEVVVAFPLRPERLERPERPELTKETANKLVLH